MLLSEEQTANVNQVVQLLGISAQFLIIKRLSLPLLVTECDSIFRTGVVVKRENSLILPLATTIMGVNHLVV